MGGAALVPSPGAPGSSPDDAGRVTGASRLPVLEEVQRVPSRCWAAPSFS